MKSNPDRPLCYDCKHRRTIPYDAHSRCAHPDRSTGLGVEGDQRGIDGGWFSWPVNFDPVWLLNCNGFEAMTPEAGK